MLSPFLVFITSIVGGIRSPPTFFCFVLSYWDDIHGHGCPKTSMTFYLTPWIPQLSGMP